MQTPCLGWSREASSPGVHHSVSITFLPTPPKEGEDRCPRSWGPQRLSSRLQSLEAPPLPDVTPFPRCPHFLGSLSSGRPLPVIPPSQGSLSPVPTAHGQTRGHSPARQRGGARVNRRLEPRPAAHAEPTRTPGPAGRPLAPEVTCTGRARMGASLSAHVQYLAAASVFCRHLAVETPRSGTGAWEGAVWEEEGVPAGLDGTAGETEAQRRKEKRCYFPRTQLLRACFTFFFVSLNPHSWKLT